MNPKAPGRRTRSIFVTKRGRAGIPISLIVLAGILVVFSLLRPPQRIPDINPANVRFPTPTAPPTPLPAPTDVHGGQIIFTCTREDVNQICRIRPDGTGLEQLTTGSMNSYYPAISRSGRYVIFAANQYDNFDLYRLAPDTLEGQRSGVSRVKKLTDNIGNAFSPSYSPDGREVVFVNRVADGPSALWLMGSDGENPHLIFAGSGDVVGASWSPDGRQVAFAMATEAIFEYRIFLLEMEHLSSPPREVPSQVSDIGGSLSWSPDMKYLLIFAGPAAARQIFQLDAVTGSAVQLTFSGSNASPWYSPDGRHIVFNSSRDGRQADLFIMNADGHSTRQLTSDPEPDWQPQWGP